MMLSSDTVMVLVVWGEIVPRARLVYVAVIGHSLSGLPCRTERAGLMYSGRLLAEDRARRAKLLSALGRMNSRTGFTGGVTALRA